MYSTRVSPGYRALGLLEDADITWFWIGRTLSTVALLTRAVTPSLRTNASELAARRGRMIAQDDGRDGSIWGLGVVSK